MRATAADSSGDNMVDLRPLLFTHVGHQRAVSLSADRVNKDLWRSLAVAHRSRFVVRFCSRHLFVRPNC